MKDDKHDSLAGLKSLGYVVLWVAAVLLVAYIGVKVDVAYTKWKFEQILDK